MIKHRHFYDLSSAGARFIQFTLEKSKGKLFIFVSREIKYLKAHVAIPVLSFFNLSF